MKRLSTLTRLSSSLACLTISILLAAQALGLLPDPLRSALQSRKELCEQVAIYCSASVQEGNVRTLPGVLAACRARNQSIRSIALRQSDGQITAVAGDH